MGYTGWGEREARGTRNSSTTQHLHLYQDSFDRPRGGTGYRLGAIPVLRSLATLRVPRRRGGAAAIMGNTAQQLRLLCVVVALACDHDEDHRSPRVVFTLARWV